MNIRATQIDDRAVIVAAVEQVPEALSSRIRTAANLCDVHSFVSLVASDIEGLI